MPAANGIASLNTLLAACRRYPLPPTRRLTFEYVLLAGVNDQGEDARRLAKLVRGIACKINLIPFNEFPGNPFRRPSERNISAFQTMYASNAIQFVSRHVLCIEGRDSLIGRRRQGRLAPGFYARTRRGPLVAEWFERQKYCVQMGGGRGFLEIH